MKSIPEISIDTRAIYERLVRLKPGEMVEYAELNKLIGRDVQSKARHNLTSAMRRALHADRIVTESVPNIGIKRLTDSEVVATSGHNGRSRIRRIANRTVRKLTSVDFDQLPPDQKIRQNAELSQLSALRAFSSEKVGKRIETAINNDTAKGPLAIARTLEVWNK
jgi:hypothetical protein